MCGIILYSGTQNATHIVLSVLKKLEYRGYDSWGIGCVKNNIITVDKFIGKIDTNKKLQTSNTAVGHTRWATNGNVTLENCHPFTDCNSSIMLVHNGIVENETNLRKELINHTINGETDSELIVHLIEEKNKNSSFYESVINTFKQIKGINAIIAVNNKNEIVCKRNVLPLIIGIDKSGIYISSDINSISKFTKRIIKFKSNETVYINNNNTLIILNDKNEPIDIVEHVYSTNNNNYTEDLFEEIKQQSYIPAYNIPECAFDMIKKANRIVLIGAGTSYNACEFGSVLLNRAKINSISILSSETTDDDLRDNDLVIAISQSGETADTIEAILRAKRKTKVISITNNETSSINFISDCIIQMNAGIENAVISSKTFTTALIILYELSKKEIDKTTKFDYLFKEESLNNIKNISEKIANSKYMMFLGKSLNYIIAKEAALKLKESLYIPCDGTSASEMKHWALSMVEKDTTIIMLYDDSCYSATKELKSRGAKIVGISNKKNSMFDYFIENKTSDLYFISNIIIIHLLIYFISKILNIDPRRPRNLAKCVTVK